MTIAELDDLLTMFDEHKRFVGEGYYRLRKKSPTAFELAYLLPDACGTTTVHPQITLEVRGDKITPRLLLDLGATPPQHLYYEEATAVEMHEALRALVAKFQQAAQQLAASKNTTLD